MLVLTARDEKEWVVRLLNAGADDYVAKPFDLGEFLARAKALVRRGKGQRSPIIAVGDLRFDSSAADGAARAARDRADSDGISRAGVSGAPAGRGGLQDELLEHFTTTIGRSSATSSRCTFRVLRRKLDDGHAVKLIHTLRGHGYVLRAERERN